MYFCKKKVRNNKETQTAKRLWIWLAICKFNRKVVGFSIGTRGAKTFAPLYDTLKLNGCEKYFTDEYNVYQSVVKDNLIMSKKYTTNVESFWSDARLFIKGLNRRTKCCFKSLETLVSLFKLYVYNYNLKMD